MLKRPAPSVREPYEAPTVRKVKLVPDEVAVTGCKSNMVGATVCRTGSRFINFNRGS
jgi:hypothetical protein